MPTDVRRSEILDAAALVFARYGFKKTSMDEVARAADLSRPGLYIHFASKEILFQALIQHLLDRTLDQAKTILEEDGSLVERLVDAFSVAHWRFVKQIDARHMDELFESARALAAEALERHEKEFRAAVVEALRPRVGKSAAELAELLELASMGLKHVAPDLETYQKRLGKQIRTVLALRG